MFGVAVALAVGVDVSVAVGVHVSTGVVVGVKVDIGVSPKETVTSVRLVTHTPHQFGPSDR